VVLDAGAEWKCYASDITRTFPISGTFSPEAAAIYKIVETMQSECIRSVRPGARFYKLHLVSTIVNRPGDRSMDCPRK
jgi:Xaa-Pro dipeptidase